MNLTTIDTLLRLAELDAITISFGTLAEIAGELEGLEVRLDSEIAQRQHKLLVVKKLLKVVDKIR